MDIATVAVFSDPDAGAPYVRAADEAVTAARRGAARHLPARRRDHRGGPGYRRRRGPPRLRVPGRERRLRAGLRRGRADLRRALPRGHRGHGLQDRGQGTAGRRGRAGAARRHRRSAAGRPSGSSWPSWPRRRPRSATRCWSRRRSAAAGAACGSPAQPGELAEAVAGASREAAAAFGDGTVFIERFVERPRAHRGADPRRHATAPWPTCSSGSARSSAATRRSSRRRRRPAVDDRLRAELGAAAVTAARAIGYVGAGTVEFVMAPDGAFCFLEVNTRLQVEHPVTELVTGLDLVRLQLEVAEGAPLPPEVTSAADRGHAIEARLCAEDPRAGFLPAAGVLHRFDIPALPGVRTDAGWPTGASSACTTTRCWPRSSRTAPTRDAARAAAGPRAGRGPAARGHHQPGPAGRRCCASPSSRPARSTPAT